MNRHQLGPVARILRHAILLLGAAIILAPFVWMVLSSLKPQGEIMTSDLRVLPQTWAAVENFTQALTRTPLLRYLLNGCIVTTSIFALQVVIALPAAYALAKLRFRGRSIFFGAILLCLLIPMHATAIPIYILFYKVGILNTYGSLILPFSISVFGIFLLRQFFMTVPDDIIDAARMDGMSEFAIVWRIMPPTALPRHHRLRHVLGGRALERLLLAGDRHRRPRPFHAPARHRVLHAGRKWHELRPTDGRSDGHHPAARRRVPHRSA